MGHPIQTPVACEESSLKRECQRGQGPRTKSGITPKRKSPKVREDRKTSQRATQVVRNGDKGGREKTEEIDGASGVCARGPVATVNACRAGRLLETSAVLLSIDERLSSATARLDFRSPCSPPSC
eukprot:1077342-Pleurochrysis_carterae.AAC.1